MTIVGTYRYTDTIVPSAGASGSGVCAKRIMVDVHHHMLGRLSTIIAKERLNGRRPWWSTARRSACPEASPTRESSARVSNLMVVRLSVTAPSAWA
jgi:hypothetical protein